MSRYVFQALFTPEIEDPGFTITFPDLPGCISYGKDYMNAINMAADVLEGYIACNLYFGDPVPEPKKHAVPKGCESAWISVESSEDILDDGDVIKVSEAAERLGVSPSRISHLISAGVLEPWYYNNKTFVKTESVRAYENTPRKAGRPKKTAVIELPNKEDSESALAMA